MTVTQSPDLVTSKLPALLDYQLSLEAPEPPRGSFDVMAALRGRQVFTGAAGCDTCHYDRTLSLNLTAAQKGDLVEFLTSL